ncbi:formin-like protein 5 [Heracleum sosnowskyi]|uniref:Formin-like protein 5 n=1 Tax=Heracleum sosnowskyi TaxID=360622 RepID=A0AAD8MEI3_9APIA|nr:formin-like protein 5 [Heracleum sosnowskyi]
MKVIKNMKKLKFWSRKKKKKKASLVENPPANAQCCCHSHQFQASAPPLPPYYEQIQEASYGASVNYHTFSGHPSNAFGYGFPPEENDIDPEIRPLLPTLPVSSRSSCYQQYMVPNPVYGMHVVPTTRRERSFGVFGCVFNVGKHLVRVACPCFRIKEAF